jgi:predicted GNAT superfamily acetyltransferase
MLEFRDLTTLDQFREVERLEGEIWGPIDLVPVPILSVTVRRGAVLVGAYDGERLVGFVYGFPALRPGTLAPSHLRTLAPSHPRTLAPSHLRTLAPSHPRTLASSHLRTLAPSHLRTLEPSHWSHMLAVHPDYRGAGLGVELKLAQRERVLDLGLDLIEWTFDPLQAFNAHLNFVKLGVVSEEYERNIYGESLSPLHGGLPTDRLVCQWWIRRPHVLRRIEPAGVVPVRAGEALAAPVVNRLEREGEWWRCEAIDPSIDTERMAIDIPTGFTAMLAANPGLAMDWRLKTRELFEASFARGYRVVDFALDDDRASGRGRYLLARRPIEQPE